MAFAAVRGPALRVARAACPLAGRFSAARALPARPVVSNLAFVAPQRRSYVTADRFTRDEVMEKMDAFHNEVISANWGDYLYLVYNVPFWEAEYEKLLHIAGPYAHEAEFGKKFTFIQEMMDVLYQVEDVRDHLNELGEMATRASGFMGTGWQAEEKIENMDEHAKACIESYDKLLAKYPDFKPKIEQTIGHGLAILRQKHKFNWGTMHRYFF
eukprot:TRINITY_DN1332_c0_g4_i1.p2 TRINITY_DN1332_c0_g4~~TRINITY_DN1332_c0_g4_i1.p2  ORF type:complete len:239 (+),score=67.96 TRINITY_DN1332_c0_g4_i1:79-717(+)